MKRNVVVIASLFSLFALSFISGVCLAAKKGAGTVKVAVFYVSPKGNDSWSGRLADPNSARKDGPFATPERARDAARAAAKSLKKKGGPVVLFRGGYYFLKKTFELNAADKGVAYRAYKNEKPRFIGGVKLDPAWFAPVTDQSVLDRLSPDARANVLHVDLKSHGITDYGTIKKRGFGGPSNNAALELFIDGLPMEIARWPNGDWAQIKLVPGMKTWQVQAPWMDGKYPEPKGEDAKRFSYTGNRPSGWAPSDDIWVHGYWKYNWADSYEKVKNIDTKGRWITTAEPGVYGYTPDRRYYFMNVFEELDAPGEWYLDRASGVLYVWPRERMKPGTEIIASVLDAPAVLLNGTVNVELRGITVEATRAEGIVVSGGSGNLVADCTVRNVGTDGINIRGGTNNGVDRCEIFQTGNSGVALDGGNRKTLVPGGNYVTNSDIHTVGRWVRTYCPAVWIYGVGNRIAHNHLHDMPHEVIGLVGNEHTIEYNEINDANYETEDVGAFYMGRDWTTRGNRIQFNYFHHIRSLRGYSESALGVGSNAVYLDDMSSGSIVYGNVFYKASRCVFIGGGRDNIVVNNIFIDCWPGVMIDARGLNWAKDTAMEGGVMVNRLNDMNYKNPPYSTRYPELLKYMDDDPGAPKGNVVTRNISVGGSWLMLYKEVDPSWEKIEDNLETADPRFVDFAHQDFRLRPDSPAFKLGFKQIPFEKIGPTKKLKSN